MCAVQADNAKREHSLGPVQQAQAFLGLQGDRLDSGRRQSRCGRNGFAIEGHLAFTDQRKSHVGEGRQVP